MADENIPTNPTGAYVYAISVDGVVRYIGKGTGARWRFHVVQAKRLQKRKERGERPRMTTFYNRLLKALQNGLMIEERVIVDGLGENAAFLREVEEIASAPLGRLWNTHEGGRGFSSRDAKAMWANPAIRENLLVAIRASWAEPAARARLVEQIKAAWADPRTRAKKLAQLQKIRSRPDVIKKIRAGAAKRWGDPELVERARLARLKTMATPESKKLRSGRTVEQWADAEIRNKMVQSLRTAQRKPETVERHRQGANRAWQSPAYREKHRAAVKAHWIKRKAHAEAND